jgi:hypothetical protein
MNKIFLLVNLMSFTFFLTSARSEIVYDNSVTPEDKFNDSLLESGDQVQLAGTARLLTEFSFEYFGAFTVNGDERARLRMYLNNGPAGENPFATPGTLLYDSQDFSITAGYHTGTISDLDVRVPGNTLTWTVEFKGVSEAESVGLLYYNPPAIGSSGNFFWQRIGVQWEAVATDDAQNNFAALITAVEAPAVQQPTITSIRKETAAVVTATTIPGKAYSLEFKSSVSAAVWQSVGGSTVRATSAQTTLQDASAALAASRFYRVAERDLTLSRTGNQATIVSFAVSGRSYALESTADLVTWSRVQETTANSSTVSFIRSTTGPREFFRIVQL